MMSATVSIHAPREGCDTHGDYTRIIFRQFQFTHPGRGATIAREILHDVSLVSIHAPREGCDSRIFDPFAGDTQFQFTHPGRGATDERWASILP